MRAVKQFALSLSLCGRLFSVRGGVVVVVDRRLPSHVERLLVVPAADCHVSDVVVAAVRRPRLTRRRTAELSDARARLRHWQVNPYNSVRGNYRIIINNMKLVRRPRALLAVPNVTASWDYFISVPTTVLLYNERSVAVRFQRGH